MLNPKLALKFMLGIIAAVMLFHLSILLKIIPYEFTWGGRLENDSQMILYELISLLVNLFLFLILLMKGGYISSLLSPKIVNIILWFFAILFGLNTIGNLLAQSSFERYFAAVTLTLSILLLVILIKTSIKKDGIT